MKGKALIGKRAKILGLPSGSGLPRKLIGRVGTISYFWDAGPGFYTIKLDRLERERVDKEVSDLAPGKFELV